TADHQHLRFTDDRRLARSFRDYRGWLLGHVAKSPWRWARATCLLQPAGHNTLDVVALQECKKEHDRQAGDDRRGKDQIPVHDLVAVEARNGDLDDSHRWGRGHDQRPDKRIPAELKSDQPERNQRWRGIRENHSPERPKQGAAIDPGSVLELTR